MATFIWTEPTALRVIINGYWDGLKPVPTRCAEATPLVYVARSGSVVPPAGGALFYYKDGLKAFSARCEEAMLLLYVARSDYVVPLRRRFIVRGAFLKTESCRLVSFCRPDFSPVYGNEKNDMSAVGTVHVMLLLMGAVVMMI